MLLRRGPRARIDVLQRADQPLLQSQLHGNPVGLASQAGLTPCENPVDELRRVAIGTRPCRDRQATHLELVTHLICASNKTASCRMIIHMCYIISTNDYLSKQFIYGDQ